MYTRGMKNMKQEIQEKIEESNEEFREFRLIGEDFNPRIDHKSKE